jgi:hypothetical protein
MGGVARDSVLFGKRGEFLISVAGEDAVTAPWAHVRRTPKMVLAQRLALTKGKPEYVAMSLDGHIVCGVTTEEYEVWKSCERRVDGRRWSHRETRLRAAVRSIQQGLCGP